MKLLLIKMIKYLFVLPGIFIESICKRNGKITFLMYHRVNDNIKKEISVSVNNFRWQLNYLKKKGFNIISMDEAFSIMKSGNIDKKYIVLTFDDGYEDFYTNAFPMLREYGFPSIVYLVPGFIETGNVFWWDKSIGQSRLMTWKEIFELKLSRLVDFGSHTQNHIDLDKEEASMILEELTASKYALEKRLNNRIRHFAYPRGIYSEPAEIYAKELYDTGVLIFEGTPVLKRERFTDFMRIKRIPVQRSDGKYLFIARLKGWLILEELFKKLISKY